MSAGIKLAALALVGTLLAGCGLSSGSSMPVSVRPGAITPVPELEGARITVGSKEFTEQRILGYMAGLALRAAGADVSDMTNVQGSNSARNAQVSGQIDLMWEYTGTAWINYLGHENPVPGAREQFEAVRAEDLRRNGLAWTNLASRLNNSYSFAMRPDAADRLGVRTISDLARVVRERPSEATFCVDSEFASRNDGLPGLSRAYGFDVPPDRLRRLTPGTIYQAVASGTCNFGEVFRTDGRNLALGLRVLDDDGDFFPGYNAAAVVRAGVLDRYPQIGRVLEPISRRLTNDVMRRLNAKVDVEGEDPADVARDWLVQQGLVRP